VFLTNLVINYLGLKILVDSLDFWPTPSNMIVSILTIFVSYFSQKYYIFKSPDTEEEKFEVHLPEGSNVVTNYQQSAKNKDI
jgi:putative flippase GtrA